MRRIALFSFVFSLLACQLFAQSGKFEFEETTHDFGNIHEENGKVSHEFKFTNKGTAPLLITEIVPSCGCTTPTWPQEAVAPGQSAVIKAEFDPMGRPGEIHKTLTIKANTEPATSEVFLTGMVIPKPKTLAEEFPDSLGSIRLASRYMNLGGITNKEPITKEFGVYNEGESAVTFKPVQGLPKHMKVAFEPMTLQPKEKGVIKIIYDAKIKNDFGVVSDNLELLSDDKNGIKTTITVNATINEYFPPMDEAQIEQAPRLEFTKTVNDFGAVKSDKIVETEFEFTNTGKQDLIIRKVKSNCSCIVTTPPKTAIKPGAKGKIKVSYNSAGREGSESKTVTVYSNDPRGANQALIIRMKVGQE